MVDMKKGTAKKTSTGKAHTIEAPSVIAPADNDPVVPLPLDIAESDKVIREYLRIVLDNVIAGVIVIEADSHRVIDVNRTAVNMIGVPKEQHPYEYRVGMTPAGGSVLAAKGHQCYVESGAGEGSGFADAEYQEAGARVTFTPDEVFRRADLVLKIQRPSDEELRWMSEGQMLMAFVFPAATHESYLRTLQEKRVSGATNPSSRAATAVMSL